jgi:hypothetical protein
VKNWRVTKAWTVQCRSRSRSHLGIKFLLNFFWSFKIKSSKWFLFTTTISSSRTRQSQGIILSSHHLPNSGTTTWSSCHFRLQIQWAAVSNDRDHHAGMMVHSSTGWEAHLRTEWSKEPDSLPLEHCSKLVLR